VELLRDGRGDTYWQSDGAQPHVVELAFQRRVALSALAVALDFRLDESYTPARLSVRAGSRWSDLVEVTAADLAEPQGWVTIPLAAPGGGPVRARLLQLVVVSNHQNGRDTHVRQVRAFGPRDAGARAAAGGALELATGQFRVFATVR
jgi:anaphase-promoting complex subunit 10